MTDLFLRNRRRQYRRSPQRVHDLGAEVQLDGQWYPADVVDTSASGLGLELDPETPWVGPDHRVEIRITARTLAAPVEALTTVRFARAGSAPDTPTRLGLEIDDLETFYAQISPSLVGQFNRRAVQRTDVSAQNVEVELRARGLTARATLRDLSIYGLGLVGPTTLPVHSIGERVRLVVRLPGEARVLRLVADTRHVTRAGGQVRFGVDIDATETPDAAAAEAALAMYAIRLQRGG